MISKPLLIIGAGGHSAVLLAELLAQGKHVAGVVSPVPPTREVFQGCKLYISDEEVLKSFDPSEIDLINGVGSLPDHNLRETVFHRFTEHGFYFEKIRARSAIIATDVVLGHGVQVMAGAIIQSGTVISDNTVINTGAIVDHDCFIGLHNHLAPGVVASGGVRTGRCVHVGTGASIIQGIEIGDNSVIGAGSSIVRDVEPNKTIIPARVRYLT